MSSEVVLGLIGFASATIGAVFGYLGRSKKQAVIDAQREQQQQDRYEEIREWMKRVDRKLEEHNGYAKMFHESSADIKLIQQSIEYLKENGKRGKDD